MLNKITLKVLFIGALILQIHQLCAHEIRPGYLEIKETAPLEFSILWKVPILNGRAPNIFPRITPGISLREDHISTSMNARTSRYILESSKNLQGKIVRIINQERTLIDVLVRVEFLDGGSHTMLLQPDNPEAMIPITASSWTVVKTFITIGIEHIIFGWDHLLFVLGLLLLLDSISKLLWTITSFTVAHSITLALSSLGQLSLPSAPVESVIALSVIFLAREYISKINGSMTLTMKWPWIVAFLFGLLHGFGFAGALNDIGLPSHAIPLSLFSFNLGVEFGQLIIVTLALIIWRTSKGLSFKPGNFLRRIPGYAMGGIASFWFISRILDIAG